MLSLVSSGDGICTSSTRPDSQFPIGSTQTLGPALEQRLRVFVVRGLAIALHQPEAVRIGRAERGDEQPARIDERTPDPFAGAGVDRQAVRIVDLGPVVVATRLVLAEREHAGQRRDAELGDRLARKDSCGHLHHGVDARRDHEPVGAGDAARFEQRVDRQAFAPRFGFSIQNSEKCGNSSPPGPAVSTARPRAESP